MTPLPPAAGERRARIVVVGGYGVFGARAAERLARVAGVEIVIAGRSEERASSAAAALSEQCGRPVHHAKLDATTASAEALRALGARVVLNASGPFQAQGYGLAQAAIAAGVHYIDIADARGFVTGIAALDASAKAAGVLAVSGASTVPAVSSAVVDHYLPSFARLTSVTYGISPGNSFDPGEATTASILGAVGLPFRARLGGQDRIVYGWQGLARHRFPGLGPRWMGYCDIPDLDLFPARYPGLETVRFKAGVEVGLFHLGLWGVSWMVRLGLLRRPGWLASPLLVVKRRLGFLGTDRGGMFVTLEGVDADGGPRRIDWHLEAMNGHGPYIPTIAAVLLARKLARGELTTCGAMPAIGLVTLGEVLAEVADLDIGASDQDAPLYARVLRQRFGRLAGRVRLLHDLRAESRWSGSADVEQGTSPLARLASRLAGLPREGRGVPLTVTFTSDGRAETWTRDFGGRLFRSRQSQEGPNVSEAVGPARLLLEPVVDGDGSLSLRLVGMRVLGIPVPRALWLAIATREWEEAGRYRFFVEARLPVGGLLVRYEGWLAPHSEE